MYRINSSMLAFFCSKTISYKSKNRMMYIWNPLLPRLSNFDDPKMPPIKMIPGGYSLWHIDYGVIDSKEGFKSVYSRLVQSWGKGFLSQLDDNTRQILLDNDWERFITQLGKRPYTDQLESQFYEENGPAIIDHSFPWKLPPGSSQKKAVNVAYKLDGGRFWNTKSISTIDQLYKTYVSIWDSMPLKVKKALQKSK